MSNNRLYPFWNHLEEGLKTGKPQNETKNGGSSVFEAIYANEDSLREFLHAMGGIQVGNFMTFDSFRLRGVLGNILTSIVSNFHSGERPGS